MFKQLIIAGLGGFLGSASRYLISALVNKWFAVLFPMGTFAVNIVGCFVIGILYGLIGKDLMSEGALKIFLITGFCGGFTTFSTFSMDGITLLHEGKTGTFLLYMGLSIVIGLGATYLGIKIVQ